LLQHLRFNDFDQLKESVVGWDLDWRQLDNGPLEAELLQIRVGDAQLERSSFSRQFEQRGSSPPGIRTLGIIEERVQGVSWCGRHLNESGLSVFHPGGEFEAVSQPGFTCYTLSFPEERLVTVGETLGFQDADRLLGNAGWIAVCDSRTMNGLRRGLRQLCDAVIRRPSLMESASFRREFEFELPARVLRALDKSPGDCNRRMPSSTVRKIAVDRALAFIEQNPFAPITVQELSQATRVSWRTLNYAFREHFGVSPKSYLKARRLNGVRRELVEAAPDEKVVDFANKWGFWHMGQFASDYRKMFGELPSETLSRGLKTRMMATQARTLSFVELVNS
jgi:AraC-like DNA-binding protein